VDGLLVQRTAFSQEGGIAGLGTESFAGRLWKASRCRRNQKRGGGGMKQNESKSEQMELFGNVEWTPKPTKGKAGDK
jgi:hypothetical protein